MVHVPQFTFPLTIDHEHTNIYRLKTDPDQCWYMTAKRLAISLAEIFARIIPPDSDVIVDLVTPEQPLLGLNGGYFTQKPAPYVVDRSTQKCKGQQPEPYQGNLIFIQTIYKVQGRGHQFTPAEKRKTYERSLQYRIPRQHWVHLAALTPLVFEPRTELPFGRALQRIKKQRKNKLKENP